MDAKQQTMADQPSTTQEQGEGQDPPAQTKASEAPVLQTPQNEEKSRKRGREEDAPASGPSEQTGDKRQRLNPYSEEEFVEDTTSTMRGQGRTEQQTSPLPGTSASSF